VGANPKDLKAVGPVFTDESYGIAVCKDNTELVEMINKGLAAVKEEGLVDSLTVKWIGGNQ
jgi:polar amino acid transport system substrate-binding protein